MASITCRNYICHRCQTSHPRRAPLQTIARWRENILLAGPFASGSARRTGSRAVCWTVRVPWKLLRSVAGRGTVSQFELLLVDFQGLDPGLKRRCWNSKLSRRPGRSRNRLWSQPAPPRRSPARCAPQHSKPATFQPEMPAEKSLWKATTHQLKKHQWCSESLSLIHI